MSTVETDIHEQDREAPDRGLLHSNYEASLTPGDGRTVDVRIVPYGEVIQHNDGHGGVPRGVMYREEFVAGVFNHQANAANRVVANVEHQAGIGGMVGRGIAFREASDGFHGSFRMLKGSDGDKALELIEDGVFDGVSIEARPVKSVRSSAGVVQRVKADLHAIAFTRFGAYKGAKVLAVREDAVILDEALLPVDLDPETIERCRRLGITLPQRYQAQPAETDTPADAGTPEDGTRPETT